MEQQPTDSVKRPFSSLPPLTTLLFSSTSHYIHHPTHGKTLSCFMAVLAWLQPN